MKGMLSRTIFFLGLSLWSSFMAGAEKGDEVEVRPKWMEGVTTANPGKFKAITPCELEFQLSWNGILKAGEATLQLGLPDVERKDVMMGRCK